MECKQIFKFRSDGSEPNSGARKKLAQDMNLSLVERRNAYFHDRPHDLRNWFRVLTKFDRESV